MTFLKNLTFCSKFEIFPFQSNLLVEVKSCKLNLEVDMTPGICLKVEKVGLSGNWLVKFEAWLGNGPIKSHLGSSFESHKHIDLQSPINIFANQLMFFSGL